MPTPCPHDRRAATPSSSSPPPASAAASRPAPRCSTAARQLGVDLDSVCGGRGICSKCQVTPAYGEFPKHGVTVAADALSPWNAVEERYDRIRGLAPGRRLGCQAQLLGRRRHRRAAREPGPQAGRAQARRGPRRSSWTRPPGSTTSRSPSPTCTSPRATCSGSSARSPSSGASPTSRATSAPCRCCSRRCARATGRSPAPSTATAREARILHVWPGFYDGAIYGLAIDVGSTTIAGHLCDLVTGEVLASTGLMNPQIRFGEDLMSRVSYAMMNPGGAAEMTARRARRAERARRRRPPPRPASTARADLRGGDRRQPGDAPPAARHRPGRARPGPVRARHRRRADALGRARSSSACTRTPASTSCPASPATSAPTPPPSRSPRARTSPTS